MLVSPFIHALLFAILTVFVPKVPKSTSFVSPTLYLSVFPDFTAFCIVCQLSVANDTGSGISCPNVSLSTALNVSVHTYHSLTSSVEVLSSVTVNVPFKVSFAFITVAFPSSSFLTLVYFAVVFSFVLQLTCTSAS